MIHMRKVGNATMNTKIGGKLEAWPWSCAEKLERRATREIPERDARDDREEGYDREEIDEIYERDDRDMRERRVGER